jgi:hypothetical protein
VIRSAGTIGGAGKEETTLLTDTQLFDVLPIPITLSAVVKHPASGGPGMAPKSRDPPYRRNLGSFALQVKGAGKPVVKGFADLHLVALHRVSERTSP